MQRELNIVVTCTSRKRFAPLPDLQLRSVAFRNDIPRRAKIWIERVRNTDGQAAPAAQMYCGEHWSIARSLPVLASKFGAKARIWICSAGYGLITSQSRIHSYNATFATTEEDSVAATLTGSARRDAAQKWWEALSAWEGPTPDAPRTIAAIAEAHPRCPLMIVASFNYLYAMEADVFAAANNLADKNLLLIISSAYPRTGALKDWVLPSDARLQFLLGGTRASLNVRVAQLLLKQVRPDLLRFKSASQYLTRVLQQQPSLERSTRKSVSDSFVRHFVKKSLRNETSASATTLLRKLRDGGSACEQARFRALYQQTVNAR